MQNEDIQTTQKTPYEPPTATFVAVNLEERLLACCKLANASSCTVGNGGAGA